MQINSKNYDIRDRNKVTLSGFKGLDTLSTTVDVSAIHSSDMQNLISRDGVNHKRYGWTSKYRLRDSGFYAINGIFDFTIYNTNKTLIYSNGKFWDLNKATGVFTAISISGGVSLSNTECKMFVNGNKVYFIGCGDFLVYSSWNNGTTFEMRRVVNDTYIPTTTENIVAEGESGERITAEERNILSKYVKNTLIGKTLGANETAQYYLDQTNINGIEVEVSNSNGNVTLTETNQNVDLISGNSFKRSVLREQSISKQVTKQDSITKGIAWGKGFNFTEYTGLTLYTLGGYLGEDSFYYVTYSLPTLQIGLTTEVVFKRNNVFGTVNKIESNKFELRFYSYDDMRKFYENTNRGVVTNVSYGYGNFVRVCTSTITDSSEEIELLTLNQGKLEIINEPVDYSEEIGSINYTETIENCIYTNIVTITYTTPNKYSSRLVYKTNNNVAKSFDLGIISTNISNTFSLVDVGNEKKAQVENIKTFNYIEKEFELDNEVTINSISNGAKLKNLATSTISGTMTILDVTKYFTGVIDRNKGLLTLNRVYSGTDTITHYDNEYVDAKIVAKINLSDKSNLINTTSIGVKFGLQGVPDRLFVVGNEGNVVYFSKDNDFSYFGEKSTATCGTSDTKIKGLERLNDTTLLAVKEYSVQEPSIYVITGKLDYDSDSQIKGAIFTPNGYQVGMGAVGGIINFNGDCLMISNDGVYGINLGENMTVDARYINHRSKYISNLLATYDLANSKAIAFNGKYYLSVGTDCFVADTKYRTYFNGDESQINYEWWKWTNIPVSVWGFINNELWFGTKDGQLCKFEDKFYDEERTNIESGLVSYAFGTINSENDNPNNATTYNDNNIIGFTLNSELEVEVGDKLIFDCDFWEKRTANVTSDTNVTTFIVPIKDYNNGEVIKIWNGTNYDEKTITISSDKTYFNINGSYSGDITFLKNVKGITFNVVEKNGTTIRLGNQNGDTITYNDFASVIEGNPAITDFKAHLIHRETVVALWCTGALDLGSRAYSKTITGCTITGEKELANHLQYGFRTRLDKKDLSVLRLNNDLSFDDIDWETISLDGKFASSYTKRLNIRNVNFVMMYFGVNTEEDLALNSVFIEFKYINKNIGVR